MDKQKKYKNANIEYFMEFTQCLMPYPDSE